MFCKNCGYNIGDAQFCPNCGINNFEIQNNTNQYHPECSNSIVNKEDPGRGLAIASIICGAISMFGGSYLTSIPAIITGKIYETKGNGENRTVAKIGKILGIVSTVISTLAIAFMIFVFCMAGSTISDLDNNNNTYDDTFYFSEDAKTYSNTSNANTSNANTSFTINEVDYDIVAEI